MSYILPSHLFQTNTVCVCVCVCRMANSHIILKTLIASRLDLWPCNLRFWKNGTMASIFHGLWRNDRTNTLLSWLREGGCLHGFWSDQYDDHSMYVCLYVSLCVCACEHVYERTGYKEWKKIPRENNHTSHSIIHFLIRMFVVFK